MFGALVSISGYIVAASTNDQGYYVIQGVPTGAHTLYIYKEGYDTIVLPINVIAGQTVTATPRDSTSGIIFPEMTGTLSVDSSPQGAAITLDGLVTGYTTPHVFRNVNASRTHNVILAIEGYPPQDTISATVNVNDTTELDHVFTEVCEDNIARAVGDCPDINVFLQQGEAAVNPWNIVISEEDQLETMEQFYAGEGITVKDSALCPLPTQIFEDLWPAVEPNAHGKMLSFIVSNDDARRIKRESFYPGIQSSLTPYYEASESGQAVCSDHFTYSTM